MSKEMKKEGELPADPPLTEADLQPNFPDRAGCGGPAAATHTYARAISKSVCAYSELHK